MAMFFLLSEWHSRKFPLDINAGLPSCSDNKTDILCIAKYLLIEALIGALTLWAFFRIWSAFHLFLVNEVLFSSGTIIFNRSFHLAKNFNLEYFCIYLCIFGRLTRIQYAIRTQTALENRCKYKCIAKTTLRMNLLGL